jgi:Fe-S oxidoreductase
VAARAAPSASESMEFSREFYDTLLKVPDGERLRACLQCGTCSGVCPYGYIMDWPPARMVAALRAGVFDRVMQTDTVWMCVSCYACVEECPAKIPITSGLMTRTKEALLLAGNVPTELQGALENSQRYGNPLGEAPRKRAAWADGLQPPVPVMASAKRPVEYLWFVGDYGSYHGRVQSVSRALAAVFQALGIDFGILGPEENTDGDSQRLAGERGLFEMLAEKNGRVLAKYEFGEIVTGDPHAFNAFRNEYPALGIQYPVRHYTELLAERLEDLKPLLTKEVNATVAYHDPCYLGRANSVYEEPRALLAAIPGVRLVDMPHSRATSICCGGGGGGMWLDGFQWEKAHTRTSEWRVREAAGVGAQVLAVACPYEPPRFEDAIKGVPEAGNMVVRDIAELLALSMGVLGGRPA